MPIYTHKPASEPIEGYMYLILDSDLKISFGYTKMKVLLCVESPN